MLKRLLGLATFIASALWLYFWEWIRSQLYERVQHMLAPYFEWLTADELWRYGPPSILVGLGLLLFWKTRPKTTPEKVTGAKGAEAAEIVPNVPIQDDSGALEVFGKSLFASEMTVSTGHLKTDKFVEISARCFNATGHSVFLGSIKGDIAVSEVPGKELMRLPTPSLVRKNKTDHIADRQEFVIVLEQRIPSEVADKILNVTSERHIQFDLGNLEILVCSHSQSSLSGRLPLWDGMTLARWPDRIETNRVIMLRAGPQRFRVDG